MPPASPGQPRPRRRPTVRDRLLAYNERVKMLASTANALALALVGFALIKPAVDGTIRMDGVFVLWVGLGLAFHVAAHYLLGLVEREIEKGDRP